MTKQEVVLCDECNEMVAKSNCTICNADLCKSCLRQITFSFGVDIREVYYCPAHHNKIKNLETIKDNEKWDEMVRQINEFVKKKLMLENL